MITQMELSQTNNIRQNLSNHSLDKELLSEELVQENGMNLLNHNVDKELFSGELVEDNRINLLNHSVDLFSKILKNKNITHSSSNSSISSNSDYENYVIKTNMSKTLSQELNIKDINFNTMNLSKDLSVDKELFSGEQSSKENITDYDIIDYEPPKEPGLSNSNVIIPSYYNLDKNPSKIFNIDYYTIIKDDIKNLRVLNKYQLDYIKKLSHEDKNELFDIFNSCLSSFSELL